ncbi:5842_t:CDS:10, partial [Ambispora leptoticha]
IVGLRLQNVYDINPKTYLFKFSKPDRKELVLIESGNRIHTTQFSRDKSITPSPFCIKLRKHIRTRRLTDVRQLGVDRIIDFEFAGVGEGTTYHIIAEFYASGNIIFTDHEYTILSLLRVVQSKENEKIAVGQIYNVNAVSRVGDPVTRFRLRDVLIDQTSKDSLKKVLNAKLSYGQSLTEHAIRFANLDPNMKVGTVDKSEDSSHLSALEAGFSEGYIIMLKHSQNDECEVEDNVTTYDEFHPFLFEQHKLKPYKEFDSFDLAVDEYYSSMESQKLLLKERNQEKAALKKLEAIKKEQYSRVENLQSAQEINMRKARLIESNVDIVDQAIIVIRNAIASSMDWKDLENLVMEEKKKGNPIAAIIAGLKLEMNQITLLLKESEEIDETFYDSSDEESEGERNNMQETVQDKVDVDIYLSAYANARKFYDVKKQSMIKQAKTLAVADKAFKSAEQKIKQDLKETKTTASINKIRKPFWFEKFLWFVSSENYLVIAGRDMQQNELLVKRYLRKGDLYVHADLHGAASVVIKNPNDSQPVPPSTLFQAGTMSVCQSKAWEAKIVTSAYWVHADQVSKTAPSGEYLTTGSFMIRGKKNFLPPVQLVYGLGLFFKVDEQSIANHLHERRPLKAEESSEIEKSVNPNNNIKELCLDDNSTDSEPEGVAETDVQTTKIESIEEAKLNESEDESYYNEEETQEQALNQQLDLSEKLQSSMKLDIPAWDKYNLDEYGEDKDAEEDINQGSSDKSKKKYISVKERRMLKKQKQDAIGDKDFKPLVPSASDSPGDLVSQKGSNVSGKGKQTKSVQTPRGKKGKLKKLKDKYADQDEDERSLRMELLGSSKTPQVKGKKGKKETQNQTVSKQTTSNLKENSIDLNKSQNDTQEDPTSQNQEAELEELDENLISGIKNEEAEEIRQLLKEENITLLESDAIENLTVLDTLTGMPLPEDNLLFAVPVCAPYTALQKFKYKVKLTPGSMKKGKACKTATTFFLNDPTMTPREKELVKSIPDMEMISVMLGKSKVSAPNIEQSKKTAKRRKATNKEV